MNLFPYLVPRSAVCLGLTTTTRAKNLQGLMITFSCVCNRELKLFFFLYFLSFLSSAVH